MDRGSWIHTTRGQRGLRSSPASRTTNHEPRTTLGLFFLRTTNHEPRTTFLRRRHDPPRRYVRGRGARRVLQRPRRRAGHGARDDPHAGVRAGGHRGERQEPGAVGARAAGARARCWPTPTTCCCAPASRWSRSSAGCTASWAGRGRSSPTPAASRCSRWPSGGSSTRTASRSARTSTAALLRLTPESCVDAQARLGVDIAMALDVCPALPATRVELERAIGLTTAWAARCRAALPPNERTLLFGIVQGGLDVELRRRRARARSRRSASTASRSAVSRSASRRRRCGRRWRRSHRTCRRRGPGT